MLSPFSRSVEKTRVAAIDVGSNSIHMLLAEVSSLGAIDVVETMKDQTRLGASLDENGCLDLDALARASTVLKRMKEVADKYKARIRAVGTYALREASNGYEFCTKLQKRTGVNVEIISGREEARLVYQGIQYGLPIQEKSSLIIDIGGGSTEVLVGQWGEERFSTSLKLGCVRLTQKYLRNDPVSDEDLLGLERYVATRLEPVLSEVERIGFENAVCSSGTVKSIKAIALGIQGRSVPDNIHGLDLTADDIRMVAGAMRSARSLKERRSLPNLESKRADVIVAGTVVLEAVTRMAAVKNWTVSSTGIREGIVIDTLLRDGLWVKGDPSDIRWRAIRAFGQKFQLEEAHAWHITSLAVSLFSQMQKRHSLTPQWREYLRSSSYLHECGRFLGFTGHHKHAAYFIRNAGMTGFTMVESDIIALIVRYHRKRVPRESDELFGDFEKDVQRGINICSSILRLAASLDRGRQGKIQELKVVDVGENRIRLEVHLRLTHDVSLELYQAAIEKQHFEQAFGVSLEIAVGPMQN